MKRILKAFTPLSRQRPSGSLLLIIDELIEKHGGPKAILGRMQQQGPLDLVDHLARVLPERIYRHLCLNIPSLALRE